MNKKLTIVLLVVVSILMNLYAITQEDENLEVLNQKAIEYYSHYEAIYLCEIIKIFYFQKTKNEYGEYHSYIVQVKPIKALKGELIENSQIACYVYYSDEHLALDGKHYLGFNGSLAKVFVVENDNLCPVQEIKNRKR